MRHVPSVSITNIRRPTARRAAILAASMIVAIMGPAVPARAWHGEFSESTGVYRIPYADGTEVTVTNDHHEHGGDDCPPVDPDDSCGPKDRIDLKAGVGEPIAASASGWIRAVVDHHGNSPGAGDGVDINGDPQDDSLEHSCGNNPDDNTVVGSCGDYNNYVWIEHPNGEWTKYSHFGTGTVTDLGWNENMWIDAGEVLGLEGDIGQATNSNGIANHLHYEVAVPNTPGTDLQWTEAGGFIQNATNLVPRVCDIDDETYADNETYTANPCDHEPPTADAGGPYFVDEGSTVQLDGTGSNDPEGNPLTYEWSPQNLDNPASAQPTYSGVDDDFDFVILRVYDQIESLRATTVTSVTVNNVSPDVIATGDAIDEGDTATVNATFVDPGTLDTHTATIDWGDGTAPQNVNPAGLPGGFEHVYGDNGTFEVTVTVTDDDGGVGADTVEVTVGNLNPALTLDLDDAIEFPGGDYVVVEAGGHVLWSAEGTDPGSDDLTFTWHPGGADTYYNDGIGADPALSSLGTFPFAASDQNDVVYADIGVDTLALTLSDDDGGTDEAEMGVIVTGTEEATHGSGWWKHQYSGKGAPHLDGATASAYLVIINAASSVFSEAVPVGTAAEAHAVLSPKKGDRRAHAAAELLSAWLEFASGAVDWDATVPLADGSSVDFLELMADAEEAILDPTTTDATLRSIERDLARVRHAS